jgi:hypothetical protein
MGVRKECWLCATHEWNSETGETKLVGFSMFSEAPWNLTSHGLMESAIYKTEGEDFDSARKEMLRAVKYLGDDLKMPFWRQVWSWIDPSKEAYLASVKETK